MSAAMAGATGGILATLLKRQFPIPRVNFFIRNMALPLAVLTPAQLSYLAHKFLVTNDVLLADTACPVCLETRAVALQLATGLLLPAVIAYAGVMVNGQKVNSEAVSADMVRVRWLPRSWRGVAGTAYKAAARHSAVLAGLAAAQVVLAGCLVSLQAAARDEVMEELERRVERDSEFKRLGSYGVNNSFDTGMVRRI